VITKYTEYWQMVLGLILVTLVLAFPEGLLGTARRAAGRRGAGAPPSEASP
jgi:ABC-type branched-subunit amino acid transport system permease subunit